nr:MAG TPA: hypothetical protein [Caudoviricetes sp.]
MKRTKQSWVLFALQIVFMLVVPCVFIWVQYGDLTQKYKISVTAILLLILVFLVFKKIFLSKWLKTIDGKLVNIETAALTITDTEAIKANKKAWRSYSIVQLATNAVIPLLCMFLAVETIKAVEDGLIKLYGCLMFCLLSVALGVIFRIAEIYSMKFTHEGE